MQEKSNFIKSKKYIGVYHYKLKNTDISYYITFKDKTNKTVKKKLGRKSQGWNEYNSFKERLKILTFIREKSNNIKNKEKIKLEDLLELYFQNRNLSLKTMQNYKFIIKNIIKITEKSSLEDLTCEVLFSLKKSLERQNKAIKTINLYMETLRMLFNFAIKKKLFHQNNPCQEIKLQKVNNTRNRFLNQNEVKILKNSLKNSFDLLLFVELSLSTGARLSSILNIKKKDISLKNQSIILENLKNQSTYLGFISPNLSILLKERHSQLTNPNEILIKLSKISIQRQLKKIFDKLFNANLDKKDSKNRVVIHTLRHSFASNLAINGVPIFTIMQLLDHKNIKQTLRYSKLSKENGLNAVKNLWKKI